MDKLKDNIHYIGIMLFVVTLLAYLFEYALNVIVANHMTPELYGDFSLALRLLAIFATGALLGTHIGAPRYLPKFIADKREHKVHNYIQWNVYLIKFTFSICVGIAAIAILSMGFFHTLEVKHITSYHLAVYILWVVPFYAGSQLINGFLMANGNVVLATGLEYLAKNILLIGVFVSAIYFFDVVMSDVSMIALMFLSFFALLFVGLIFIASRVPSFLYASKNALRWKPRESRSKWLMTSLRLSSSSIIIQLIYAADFIVIEMVLHNEHALGIYAAAITISGFMYFVSVRVYRFLTAKVSALLRSKNGKKALQYMLDRLSAVVIVLLVTMSFIIVIFGNELLGMFGPDYSVAYWPLIILTAGNVLAVLGRPAGILLGMGGREGLLLWANAVQFVALLIITIPLTYWYGILGTAWAAFIVQACRALAMVFCAKAIFKLRPVLIM